MQMFLDAGCKPDVNRQETVRQLSPLHIAAEEGHSRVAGVLIRAGAGVDLTDSQGRTPLHLAAKHGHAGVVVDLLLRGSNAEAEDETGEFCRASISAVPLSRDGRVVLCILLIYLSRLHHTSIAAGDKIIFSMLCMSFPHARANHVSMNISTT